MHRLLLQGSSSNVERFWRGYVHIGVLTYSIGALAVVVYALVGSFPHRHTVIFLGGLSLAASIGPFRWLGLRLVSTRWSKVFFAVWAALTFVFIAVGAVLDGGVTSPISYLLVLPMLFAGLVYSAGTVCLLAAFGIVTTLIVSVLTTNPSSSTTTFICVSIMIAGVLTAAAAQNRDRLMRQLMEAASVDALTGCLSRGAFQERLDQAAAQARRDGTALSLIVADVDNLKTLNDSAGHHFGDRALRSLARILTQTARECDVVGRLGGDEFAMLLHEADQDAAMFAATALTDALRAAARSETVTASLGVSSWLGADDRPDELLRRADEALYAAKHAGRNRAAQWEPPPVGAHAGRHWLGRRARPTAGVSHPH